jgi:hypothetical protein
MIKIEREEIGREINQFIDDRSNGNGPKVTSKGLRNESTNERCEASCSTKDCECIDS